jgi:hypothetical protein
MNTNNQKFLLGLGLFFLLISTLMLLTGYWSDLREFGVSERFFTALAWLQALGGAIAVLVSGIAGRQRT